VFQRIQGKVFQYSRLDPKPRSKNSAERLVLTDRSAAERFLAKGKYPGLYVQGQCLFITWNRDHCALTEASASHQSRVIFISGPKDEFTAEGLEQLFHSMLAFMLVERRVFVVSELKMVELSFWSIYGPSRAAFKCFCELMEKNKLVEAVEVWYGQGPCNQ
jgi:hypothetical protein